MRLQQRGTQPAVAVIALAMIDEKRLDQEGRWPWPRSKIAQLVNRLSADGAKVIAFDIGFLEPEVDSTVYLPAGADQALSQLADAESLQPGVTQDRVRRDINDRLLADAIQQAQSPTILGYFFHMNAAELDYDIGQAEIDRQLALIANSKYPMILQEDPDTADLSFITAHAPESTAADTRIEGPDRCPTKSRA